MIFRKLEAKFKELNVLFGLYNVFYWSFSHVSEVFYPSLVLAGCIGNTKFTILLLIQGALILTAELLRLWNKSEGHWINAFSLAGG